MEVRALLADDRAVAPVIAVILLVAITVILAAVIGGFVLGVEQDVQTAPEASFDFEFGQAETGTPNPEAVVNVTHRAGDRLEVGENTNSVRLVTTANETVWVDGSTAASTVRAGDTYDGFRYAGEDTLSSGETVRVVWTGPENESSATLAQRDAPT